MDDQRFLPIHLQNSETRIDLIPINLQYNFKEIADDFIKQLIKETLVYYSKIGFFMPWISYLAKNKYDNYVGICSFKGKPINNVVEIAYCTHPNYENNGYAIVMCKKLIKIARNENKEITIIAHTLPEINPSVTVLKRNGFIYKNKIIDAEDGEISEWVLEN
jgi:ribosomal-protein-alanine N-acetyltransferase